MTAGTPGVDHPETRTPVDVQAASRGDTLISWVEEIGDAGMLLSVPRDRAGRPARCDLGEHVVLVWKGPEELRALPTELVEVVRGEEPRWRLKSVGPATRGQRRSSVRVPIALPTEAQVGGARLAGTTIDVSEGGLHCLFRGPGSGAAAAAGAVTGGAAAGQTAQTGGTAGSAAEPSPGRFEVGDIVDVVLTLDDGAPPIRNKAEVVRPHHRTDGNAEVSLRFVALPEREGDRIRRRVFAEMRELRARGVL